MISSDWSRKLFRDANKGVRIIGILTALQKPTHLVLTSVFFLIYKFKEDINFDIILGGGGQPFFVGKNKKLKETEKTKKIRKSTKIIPF